MYIWVSCGIKVWHRETALNNIRQQTFLLLNEHVLTKLSFFSKGDCQGHRPSVPHLSLKFKTSYMTCHSSACSAAARNPREITISLTFVCRKPSCIKKHNFPLRSFQGYCTIHLYSKKDFRLVTFSYPSSQWSIYDASFLLFDTSLQSSSIHLGLKSVLSCQSIRNEGETQSKV